MGSLFKKPKAPKMSASMSPNPVDPGAPPGDPANTDATGAIADAATRERMLRQGRGLQSTFTNGAMGYADPRVRVRRASATLGMTG